MENVNEIGTDVQGTDVQETTQTSDVKVVATASKTIEEVTVHGEILAIDDIVVDNEVKAVMVKILNVETGVKIDVVTSEGMLDAFKSNGGTYRDLVVKGNNISVVIEKHLGLDLYPTNRATTYVDKNGEKKNHKRTGWSMREVLPLGTFQTARYSIMNTEQARVDVQINNMDRILNKQIDLLVAKGFDAETAAKLVLSSLK